MIDWKQARQFWRDGLDTHEIAKHFKVHESVVYNGLNGAWSRKGNADDVSGDGGDGMPRGGDQSEVQSIAVQAL